MIQTKTAKVAGSILLVGTLLFSFGCGFKGDPLPPDQVVPKRIRDLRYSLNEDGAKLTWTYPLETLSGDTIKKIDSFQLYRAEIPLADYCHTCPIPFGEPLDLPGGVTLTKSRKKGVYTSGLLRAGNKYFFKLRSRTSWWGSSNDSNIVSFVYQVPSDAPEGLEAKVAGTSVDLMWQPVTTLNNGEKATQQLYYQVLRSQEGKKYSPLARQQKRTTFTDTNLNEGSSYSYKVKSFIKYDEVVVGGGLSDSVNVVLSDTTAPARVKGVNVVAGTKDIRVFWDRVSDQDLAGYRIYRKTGSSSKAMVIGEVGKMQTIFVDKEAPQGAKLYYQVSAFDSAKPANEGKLSEEATTRD